MKNKKRRYYTLANDKMFKNILLKYINILQWFINGIMRNIDKNCNINIIGIENVELYKDRMYIKNKIIDSLIITDYAYFNIELNNMFDKSRQIRNIFYINSIFINKVKVKEDYNSIDKPIIQINLNLNQKKTKKLINKYVFMNEYCIIEKYDDLIYIVNIDVARIVKIWYNLNRNEKFYEKYKHILIIGMSEYDLKNIKEGDNMIDTVIRKIDDMNRDEGFYQALTDEEDIRFQMNTQYNNGVLKGEKRGEKRGIKKGFEQGATSMNLENAKKMKLEKLPIDMIKKITGLDVKTIMTL